MTGPWMRRPFPVRAGGPGWFYRLIARGPFPRLWRSMLAIAVVERLEREVLGAIALAHHLAQR
jgi:hypothetical protein